MNKTVLNLERGLWLVGLGSPSSLSFMMLLVAFSNSLFYVIEHQTNKTNNTMLQLLQQCTVTESVFASFVLYFRRLFARNFHAKFVRHTHIAVLNI